MEAAKSPFPVLLARLTVVAALTGTMLIAAHHLGPRVSFWQQGRLAKKLVAELELASNPETLIVLKQVSSLGNPAIEALVLASASERADIALAARRIIEQELAAWQIQAQLDKTHSSLEEPMGLLAAALARHVDEFGAFGQQWATRLTLDIVDLASEFSVESSVHVLADCSTVLSSVPALGPRMLTLGDPTRPGDSESIVAALPEVRVPALRYDRVARPRRRQPTVLNAEPWSSIEIADNPKTTQELLNSTEIPRSSHWVPEWVALPNATIAEPHPPETSEAAPPVGPGELIDVPSPAEQEKLVASLRSLETRELLAQLKEADPFQVAAVREVLAARGIAADELTLAGRLFAEDAADRLKLVDDLKVLPARTARRWLRELLDDQDAEVRHSALTALATTNDPELRSIARDIAVRDPDRRVADLALQIMREMR
jgi:hypothetical protein